jgi:hypothetical protein
VGLISLVLPYFERREATDAALHRMAALYPETDMEVVIVDDGSRNPYCAPRMPFRVSVIRLPEKDNPLNPCLPINIGVAYAKGDVIAISNPEIMHRTAVLPELVKSLETADYVAAACWCPDTNRWHAHSTRNPLYADKTQIKMPAGAQYHFLAVLSRDLFRTIQGFDCDYRDGAGYDDNDLLMRLNQARARFAVRDDLIVDHSRNGAHAAWTPQMFERNRQLFVSKWGP